MSKREKLIIILSPLFSILWIKFFIVEPIVAFFGLIVLVMLYLMLVLEKM